MDILGVQVSLQVSSSWGVTVHLAPEARKLAVWVTSVAQVLEVQAVTVAFMLKLVGRLSFAAFAIWGGQARARLRSLYTFCLSGCGRAPCQVLQSLRWWSARLLSASSVTVQPSPVCFQPLVVYTDAEGSAGFGVTIHDGLENRWVAGSFPVAVRSVLNGRRTQIFPYEVMAVWVAIRQFIDQMSGRVVLFFVDNTSALASIAKGSTRCGDVQPIIADIWDTLVAGHVWSHWKWVPSKLNLSDLPSRGKPPILGQQCPCRVRMEKLAALISS